MTTSSPSNGSRSARTNQIPIGTVTGKVTFPNGINGKNSWAWLHTKNTSTTNRGDNGFPDVLRQ